MVAPEPSKLDDLESDPDLRQGVAVLVTAESPEKRVRINITARESQIAEIDRRAKEAGLTRSGYMVQCALDRPVGRIVRGKRRHREVA